ncbi:MAG: DUF3962 domain-containing protein [Ktedonobacterales bacterium]|nr:DUF3962 domain-containing protein [Ktedonobacterales bacterium]
MIYPELHLAAFHLRTDTEVAPETYFQLPFPRAWREPLTEVAQQEYSGRPQRGRTDAARTYAPWPIASLNATLRAVAADVILTGRFIPKGETEPWIYSTTPVTAKVVERCVRAWIRDAFPHASDEVRARTAQVIRIDEQNWEPQPSDWRTWKPASNGTALPVGGEHTFRLLSHMLAAQLTENGRQLQFGSEARTLYRVPANPGSQVAEVMTWPPFSYTKRGREWPYSLLLTLSVQTIPFQAIPVIHVDVGIRRWVAQPLPRLPFDPTVYFRVNVAWMLEAPHQSASFQVAKLHWRTVQGGTSQPVWRGIVPSILDQVQRATPFPQPADLVARDTKHDAWWRDEIDPVAAIVYSNRMEQSRIPHEVGAGLMPQDRRAVLEQVALMLAPLCQPVANLSRQRFKVAEVAQSPALGMVAVAEEVDEEEDAEGDAPPSVPDPPPTAKVIEQQAQRTALAQALRGQDTLLVWHQTSHMRTILYEALTTLIGPPTQGDERDDEYLWEWRTPELRLRVITRWLAANGSGLTLEAGGGTHVRRRSVGEERADQVAVFLQGTPMQVTEQTPGGVIIEIGGPAAFFPQTADPKDALRMGAGAAHCVSQFIVTVPEGTLEEKEEKSAAARATQAWRDLFRQCGLVKHPPQWRFTVASQPTRLPEPLRYVGVWLINHTAKGSPTGMRYQLPVLVHLSSDRPEVMLTVPGLGQWLPYSTGLLEVLRRARMGEASLNLQRPELIPTFIERTLERDVPGDTLVLVHAQNLRRAWPWLKNTSITPDEVQIGRSRFAIAERPGLRIVRVRSSMDHETPECYGEHPGRTPVGIGFTRGLWRMGTHVFGSTADKPKTFMNLSKDLSKAGPWGKEGRPPAPGSHAWNPSFIEIVLAALQSDDDPWVWAAATHQLRLSAGHFDDALALPLPLHLAKLVEEYVMPFPSHEGALDEDEIIEDEEERSEV